MAGSTLNTTATNGEPPDDDCRNSWPDDDAMGLTDSRARHWDNDEASPESEPASEGEWAFGLSDGEAELTEALEVEDIGVRMPAYDAVLSEEHLQGWRAAEGRFHLKLPWRKTATVVAAPPAPTVPPDDTTS